MAMKITLHTKKQESSVTRLKSHLDKYDISSITAWRNKVQYVTDGTLDEVLAYEGEVVPVSVKKKWNRDLRAALLKLGYGVTSVKGKWRETGWDSSADEESYFVVNLTNDPAFKENLFKLGEAYNQDSVLLKEKGSDEAYVIGTNVAPPDDYKPAYGKTINVGKIHYNLPPDYVGASTGIKNKAFTFKKDSEALEEAVPSKELDTYFVFQNYTRQGITECATPVLKKLGLPTNVSRDDYEKALHNSIGYWNT